MFASRPSFFFGINEQSRFTVVNSDKSRAGIVTASVDSKEPVRVWLRAIRSRIDQVLPLPFGLVTVPTESSLTYTNNPVIVPNATTHQNVSPESSPMRDEEKIASSALSLGSGIQPERVRSLRWTLLANALLQSSTHEFCGRGITSALGFSGVYAGRLELLQ
jgi:hypothetical protein